MKELSFQEWLEWRKLGIGSSEAPAIMGTSPWCTAEELFHRRTGRLPAQEVTYPMQRGVKLEPEARLHYERILGIPAPKRILESSTWPVARGSFDGLNTDEKRAIEIKCPGRVDHIEALNDKIPDKYLWQCVHLLLVCGYDRLDYWSYSPKFDGPKYALVVFKRNNFLEQRLLKEEKLFWKCLLTDTPPAPPAKPREIFRVRRNK